MIQHQCVNKCTAIIQCNTYTQTANSLIFCQFVACKRRTSQDIKHYTHILIASTNSSNRSLGLISELSCDTQEARSKGDIGDDDYLEMMQNDNPSDVDKTMSSYKITSIEHKVCNKEDFIDGDNDDDDDDDDAGMGDDDWIDNCDDDEEDKTTEAEAKNEEQGRSDEPAVL